MERYITDSLDEYPIGPCPHCGGGIARADLERDEDWTNWLGGDTEVPLLWQASGKLRCAICEQLRNVTADVRTGSVRPVFQSMKIRA